MKFTCSKCDTRYRLSNEKLKDKDIQIRCRNCGSLISVSLPPPAPKTDAPKEYSPSKNSVSNHKKGRNSSLPPDLKLSDTTQKKQWHVSINNVPLGPIRTKELISKMISGAVHEKSLVWTDGLKEWIVLRKVPELSELLNKIQNPNNNGLSEIIPGNPTNPSSSERDLSLTDPDATQLIERPSFPSTQSETSSTKSTKKSSSSQSSPQKPPSSSIKTTAPSWFSSVKQINQKLQQTKPIPYWISLIGISLFSLTFAILWAIPSSKTVKENSYPHEKIKDEPENILTAKVDAKTEVKPTAPAPGLQEQTPPTEPIQEQKISAPTSLNKDSSPHKTSSSNKKGSSSTSKSSKEKKANTKKRSSNQKTSKRKTSKKSKTKKKPQNSEILKRFSGSSSTNLSSLRSKRNSSSKSSNNGEGLDAKQLSVVISKNRPQLRRCYEIAARGMSKVPNVRIDVQLTVNSSGQVTRVSTKGKGIGSLTTCIKTTVKRWRFPRSGNVTKTSFPVVFQGS